MGILNRKGSADADKLEKEITIDSPIEGRDALTIVRPSLLSGAAAPPPPHVDHRGGEGAAAPLSTTTIEVEIKTGRTHQIRIHLASIGHPVAGDRRYGGSKAARLMLHAWKLEHPSVGTLEAAVPW